MRTIIALLFSFIGADAIAQTPGPDFSGQNLTDRNFSRQDLTNANFSGATLDGAQFVGATLVGANFSRASLKPSAKGPASFLNANLTRARFPEAKLQDANLQYADVTCTDFSSSDLTAALFAARPRIDPSQPCRTKFANATMKLHQFPTSLWRYADFTNTNFVDLDPSSFSLRGVDISNAILAGVRLAGFDLTHSTLNGVDFTAADLRGARLDHATAVAVKLVDAKLSYMTATNASFFDPARPDVKADFRGATAVNADFTRANLSLADLRGANFSAAKFAFANLDNAVLQSGEGRNATQVLAADFSNATLRNTHLNGVAFQNARLVKATIQGTFGNTNFSNAVLTGADFEGSTLQGVSFNGSVLQNAGFQNTEMRESSRGGAGVDFSCAQLGGANFNGATITTASFNASVMPRPRDCCREVGGTYHCGIDPLTRAAYGPTVLPALEVPVTCPNGDQAVCSDAQWTIPDWRTSACNRQGVLERVWTPPSCGGGGGGTDVTIPDPKFRECLQIAFFGSAQGQKIKADFAKTVPEISCPGRGIADVTGLEAFTALRKLDLSNNNIANGSIYSKLSDLQVLRLAGNKLTQLSVSRLGNLSYLDASHNRISGTIGGWATPINLQYLDLSDNRLSGLLRIDIQRNLFFVDLSHNRLTGVGDLSSQTSLVYLYLQNNALKTIGSLKALDANGTLRSLNLACNPELDCASLDLDGTQLLQNSLCGKEVGTCGPVTATPAPPPSSRP